MAMSSGTTTASSPLLAAQHDEKRRLDHIDGIRTVAIIAVLLFHIKAPMFSNGGYLGVDIFFTLSGYLITRNILQASFKHTFSFSNFYMRRIFRLFPACCVTILFTLLLTYVFIIPVKAAAIFQSAFAALTLWSNLYFLRQGSSSAGGYFDQVNETSRPLLHFWSLSVEEQFYLFWPCFLLVLCFISTKLQPRAQYAYNFAFPFYVILIVGVASFVFAQTVHGVNESWSFYHLLARIYQFAAGALLAIRCFDKYEQAPVPDANDNSLSSGVPLYSSISDPHNRPVVSPSLTTLSSLTSTVTNVTNGHVYLDDDDDDDDLKDGDINDLHDAMSILSIGVLFISFVFLPNNASPLFVLPTTLSTVVLLGLPKSLACEVFLSLPVMVKIGRASYSIYLVHWPIMTVLKRAMEAFSVPVVLISPSLFALSFVVGFYVHEWVEEPYRKLPLRSNRVGRWGSLGMLLALLAATATTFTMTVKGMRTKGFEDRFPEYGRSGWRNLSSPLVGQDFGFAQKDVSHLFPQNDNVYVKLVGDYVNGTKSRYVFFGDSFTEHFTFSLHNIGHARGLYFELHFAYHCGFRPSSELETWNGFKSGFVCADSHPVMWEHAKMLEKDSVIVVANWWCMTTVRMLDVLHDLQVELRQKTGKEMALFKEPPGISEQYKSYYACADFRVLPLGRRLFRTGARSCLPRSLELKPEDMIAEELHLYAAYWYTFARNGTTFDLFKYLCTQHGDPQDFDFSCRPPVHFADDSFFYDIGYKYDLAHLTSAGSDYVTDFVDQELFPSPASVI